MYFSQQIIGWYHTNKRDLPWRQTNDPYIIWLSEIILQQTRVNQGLPYFYRFAEHYPTVKDFASATEEEVLRHWQGLGYYSRGRNMYKTALVIMEKHGGVFPSNYKELIQLPGIGEYTASAISSFSRNEYKAVVDGNVSRVLSRFFSIQEPINSTKGKKIIQRLAEEVIAKENPGIHNQAIMEFGALQCKPINPLCATCPLQLSCKANIDGEVHKLPIKIKAAKSKDRYFNYFVIRKANEIQMQKRSSGDIWENLYELPLVESKAAWNEEDLQNLEEFKETFGPKAEIIYSSRTIKHILSHQNIYARFFEITGVDHEQIKKRDCNYVLIKDLDKLAKPKLIVSFFDEYLYKT